MKVTVRRDYDKFRYVLEFEHRKVKWVVFLDDSVYDDPDRFDKWFRGVIDNITIKL